MNKFIIKHLRSGGIITNYFCTSSCKHCLYNCSPQWEKRYINPKTAEKNLQTVRSLGCRSVHIGGGAQHIGAVALVGRHRDGAVQESVTCLTPHKDDAPARSAARAIHRATGATVCVTAGIHVDDITEAEIADVLRAVDEGVARLIRRLEEQSAR